MEISMLIYSNPINLYDVLITVHNIALSWTLTQKFFYFFALFFSYLKQTDPLGRISTLKEKAEAIQGIFESERGKGNFRKNNCAF